MSSLGRRYRVAGRVQGVGFRAYTCVIGAQLGMSGWVVNLGDGTVMAFAFGPAESHRALESALRRGPGGGRVDRVDSESVAPEAEAPDRSHRFG